MTASFVKKWLWCIGFFAANAFASVSVTDDAGKTVTLPEPAKRIVSLSPHATELLFAVGAGHEVVGATQYSDYPEAARRLPQVGDFRQLDLERIFALKPDLIVLWSGGNSPKQVAKLEKAGIPVFYSNPRRLKDIPDNMIRLGILSGHEAEGRRKAGRWQERLDSLKRQYSHRSPLRVFYQVSDTPLFTLSGRHIVQDAIELCGGQNVFADLPVLAPGVSTEAVLLANPEVIVSSKGTVMEKNGLVGWKRYTMLDAVRYGNLFGMEPDWLDRPGPRMLDGTGLLCRQLEKARKNRTAFLKARQ